tara:strand:+ start:1542 stop:1703 length:162 start_codon:yes stop_codon:yes gene_type:complete
MPLSAVKVVEGESQCSGTWDSQRGQIVAALFVVIGNIILARDQVLQGLELETT